MEESNPELESFRQKWKEEVSARAKSENKNTTSSNAGPSTTTSSRRPQPAPRLGKDRAGKSSEYEDEVLEPKISHAFENSSGGAPTDGFEESPSSSSRTREPQSALEHYEKAVERESQGSLGDSLTHYRKAFKVCFPFLDRCAELT
jgi:F-box protein 9